MANRQMPPEDQSIPEMKRVRRQTRLAALAAIVSEIEADVKLDAISEGIQVAKRAVLDMIEGRSETEANLIREVYARLEEVRQTQSEQIRLRLGLPQ